MTEKNDKSKFGTEGCSTALNHYAANLHERQTLTEESGPAIDMAAIKKVNEALVDDRAAVKRECGVSPLEMVTGKKADMSPK